MPERSHTACDVPPYCSQCGGPRLDPARAACEWCGASLEPWPGRPGEDPRLDRRRFAAARSTPAWAEALAHRPALPPASRIAAALVVPAMFIGFFAGVNAIQDGAFPTSFVVFLALLQGVGVLTALVFGLHRLHASRATLVRLPVILVARHHRGREASPFLPPQTLFTLDEDGERARWPVAEDFASPIAPGDLVFLYRRGSRIVEAQVLDRAGAVASASPGVAGEAPADTLGTLPSAAGTSVPGAPALPGAVPLPATPVPVPGRADAHLCPACGAPVSDVRLSRCDYCGDPLPRTTEWSAEVLGAAERFDALQDAPALADAWRFMPPPSAPLRPPAGFWLGLAGFGIASAALVANVVPPDDDIGPPVTFACLALTAAAVALLARAVLRRARVPLERIGALVLGVRALKAAWTVELRLRDGGVRSASCAPELGGTLNPGAFGIAYLRGDRLDAFRPVALPAAERVGDTEGGLPGRSSRGEAAGAQEGPQNTSDPDVARARPPDGQ